MFTILKASKSITKTTFLKVNNTTKPTIAVRNCIINNFGRRSISIVSMLQKPLRTFDNNNKNNVIKSTTRNGYNNNNKNNNNELNSNNTFSYFSKRNFGPGRNLPSRINAEDDLFGYTGQPGARVVKRRLPGSVYKMNMVSKMVVGMKVDEALTQLEFLQKRRARPVHRAINNAVNLCSILHDLKPEELYVSGAYVGKGTYKKLIKFKGRGKVAIERRANCRLTVVVRKDTRLLKDKHPRLKNKKKKRKMGGVSEKQTIIQ